MEPSFAQLDSLVALIVSAVDDVKAEYRRLNQTFPNLDDAEAHPLDSQETPQRLKKAVQIVSGACAQLSTILLPPSHALVLRANEYMVSASLCVALESKVADQLKDRPHGVHLSEIAAQNGIDEGKMGRVLRLLATKHCFSEVRKDVFANNRLSILMTSDNPIGDYAGLLSDEVFNASSVMHENLIDPIMGPSYAPDHTPFARYYKHNLWDYCHIVNPVRGKRFSRSMVGFGSVLNMKSMIHGFPWKDLPPGTTLCDLGGGVGYIGMDIALLNPNVHVVLQDLGAAIEQGKKFWQDNAPGLVKQDRVEFTPIDFFKESPVAGCDYYYMKHIIHNWTDEANSILLSNITKVMKPSSRIIIQEYVMQHLAADAQDHNDLIEQAPTPLLPNYGEGRVLQYYLDLDMMSLLNSRERTLSEFKQLGSDAGLELVNVWDCGELSALEYKLAGTSASAEI